MANFPMPNDASIEDALAKLIRHQLSLHGIDADAAAVNRIRQQLPVAEWLDGIVEAGKRASGDMPAAVDIVADAAVSPQVAVDPMVEPETAVEAKTTPDDGNVEAVMPKIEAEGYDGVDAPSGTDPLPDAAARKPLVLRSPLRVPNATAGIEYDKTLDLSVDTETAGYRFVAISGLEETGLAFDPATNRLHGVPHAEPAKSVEHELEALLERKDDASVQAVARLSLFINPHPRTLWKQIEPDAALEHRKEHRCSLCDAGPPMVLAASVRGRSHENGGSFREDDFHVARDTAGNWTVVAVSDGAGSALLSRLGSKIATETCVASLLATLEQKSAEIEAALKEVDAVEDSGARIGKLEEVGKSLLLEPVGRAAFAANKAIRDRAAELGVEEKALAATLMFAALRRIGDEVLVASYWIGDGAAALLDPASNWFRLLGEADGGEFSGQTRFLLSSEFPTSEKAWESIHKRFRSVAAPAGAALLLMTDGVSDPKFGTDNALRDPARWLSFWNDDLARQLPLSEPDAELAGKLEDYLQFWSQGEHDDRTLALVSWP